MLITTQRNVEVTHGCLARVGDLARTDARELMHHQLAQLDGS
jgi:hypothetical protein